MTQNVEVRLEGYPVVWRTGQTLIDWQVTLGQQEKASGCQVTLADPDGTIAADLINHSLKGGGIVALPSSKGPENPGSDGSLNGPGAGVGNQAVKVGSPAAAWEAAIVQECLRQGVTDDAQIAYILATAKHESDNFATLTEYASGEAYEGRSDLGNNQPGDGARFKGLRLL